MNSVSTLIRIMADCRNILVQFSAGPNTFVCPQYPNWLLGDLSLLSSGYGVKWLHREADHSIPV